MSENTPEFVHLHVHTQYSLLDGAIRLEHLLKRSEEYGMKSAAITDHGTMFGAVEFYEKARKAGIKPIIGCECYLAPRRLTDKTAEDGKKLAHLVLLARDLEGYTNLCKLASIAQLEGFYYKPRIDREVLKDHAKGLIALSACLAGDIPRKILAGDMAEADRIALEYAELFGPDNFYLEVQNNGIDIQEKVNVALLDMSKRLSLPLVATNDCHYLDKTDVRAHEVLMCVQTGSTMNDPNRFQFGTDQLYFKSPEEMYADFKDYPGAIENTVSIAERCNVEFDFSDYHFPQYDAESGKTADELFEEQVWEGLERRMEVIRKLNPDVDEEVYMERARYEVGIIIDMGFPGYFLIVADFIRYGKENGIPVGPGRGSAAGSIVAYAMNITDLDPIEHGLIFERFLNPSRISMPDIDVDFCINGREKVFKYVIDRYGGGEYVSQIITFGKLKTKAVIRDVGRALDIPLREVDEIAKMVPDTLGIKLDQALKDEPRILELANERPEIADLIEICRTLEGLPRHASTHAAGVVISDKPLVEYLPLFKGKKGEVVTQFDMKFVEHIGLVKFDFLGLRNLTIIENCLNLIREQGIEAPDLLDVDFNDPTTYELLCRGDTTGVFQLESSGMKDLLCRLKPECFNDITALVALYRPGPLDSGMVDAYVERKHGREEVDYLHPMLKDLLTETYGVILYQEQVMKIAGILASYTMADADGLRKAMGKKIAAMMEEHRNLFMKGAEKNGVPAEKAKEIFDLMEKFGGYGFNKSHSAAYALVCFQTAYLKAHFPVEFTAALLTSEMGNVDGIVKFIEECSSHNIDVLPPDVNSSGMEFAVKEGSIRFGLVAVKNVGEAPIEAIIEARREGGEFGSLFEFCERVNLRKVNKRVLEALIKCGAFDSTGAKRAQLMGALEDALDHGQRVQKEANDPQLSLFGGNGAGKKAFINSPVMLDLPEWDDKEKLALEKDALGFYISGHPLDRFLDLIKTYSTTDTLAVEEIAGGSAVRIGGAIKSNKVIRTKRGDMMSFALLEDKLGTIEVVVFSSLFERASDILTVDRAVIVLGEAQRSDYGIKIIAEEIVPVEKAGETWTDRVRINLDLTKVNPDDITQLKGVFHRHPGNLGANLHFLNPRRSEVKVTLPETLRLAASEALTREIDSILGPGCVQLLSKPAKLAPKKKKKWGGGKGAPN